MKLSKFKELITSDVPNKKSLNKKFDELKNRPIDLGIFVPMTSDGRILEEPFEENYYDSDGLNYHLYTNDCEDYEKACDLVVFSDYNVTCNNNVITIADSNSKVLAFSSDYGDTYSFSPHRLVGDLLNDGFDLTVKRNKYKEILGYIEPISDYINTLKGEPWEKVVDKLKAYPFEVGMIYVYNKKTKRKIGRLQYLGPSKILGSGLFNDLDNDLDIETYSYTDVIIDLTQFEYNPMLLGRLKKCTENMNCSLGSIVFSLRQEDEVYTENRKGVKIKPYTNNPFVEIGGERVYYQRPLVWSLEDKQNLIESIYNYNGCGLIVFRLRSPKWIEEQTSEDTAAWIDIVDGKQRIDAILGFMNDDYPDKQGRYYSEFSGRAKSMFLDHQLFSYAEIKEDTPDEKVLEYFLKINTTGVAQDQNHLTNLTKYI